MNTIKALFLAANPSITSKLGLDEEIRSITEKVHSAEHRHSLELISAWAIRPDDLLQSLNTYKPQIVHFSGHGSPAGEIVLVNGDRLPKPVSAQALKFLFTTLLISAQKAKVDSQHVRNTGKGSTCDASTVLWQAGLPRRSCCQSRQQIFLSSTRLSRFQTPSCGLSSGA
ncbi:MAG TPA: hypothetical protein VL461_10995 [Dictyobacter sp.]|nr:hypothetical protein [Dictyobacter sp.]